MTNQKQVTFGEIVLEARSSGSDNNKRLECLLGRITQLITANDAIVLLVKDSSG